MATIEARRYWNDTGIELIAGVTYRLTASGIWKDADTPCGPDGYDSARLRPFRWLRRSRPHQWFALMGQVGNVTFLIGSGTTFTSSVSGELRCYANDAPFMYGNNSGVVTLNVERVSAS